MDNKVERNVVWEAITVNPEARAALKTQTPCCVWLTGMPCSGKSSLAKALDRNLYERGYHTFMLDGDNVRHGLCSDLGFSAEDRSENIRRVGEAAKLMVEAGVVAIVSLVSPFEIDRERARARFAPGQFVEVHIDADLATCEERDVKGMYAKARKGLINDFTGIDSPYETPRNPELHLDTSNQNMQTCSQILLELVLGRIKG